MVVILIINLLTVTMIFIPSFSSSLLCRFLCLLKTKDSFKKKASLVLLLIIVLIIYMTPYLGVFISGFGL